ncbi:tetratricopeptide repeat protein, partial [Microcystis aeruginosa]|uniref:tetratricopeptide repeat protein n=1 Tax=Microcystis aeruginosa TaxID=1126 RepID=UPI0018AD2CD5
MTETYLAEDEDLPNHPPCVVKQLKPYSTEPETLGAARRLFETEAKVLSLLGVHDQITRLLAYFEENQEFYLVEEFIEGETLEQELKEVKRFSEAQVIDLLQEVLPILQFVHEHRVIHRDLKPSNLIRRKTDGKLVLTGFGSVKQVQTQMVTSGGQMIFVLAIGTPGYMPNEQQGGNPRFSSDIYALGMTAIYAVTGIPPNELLQDPQTGEVIWRRQAPVPVSDGLAAILDKMVRAHFRDRYQTVEEVLEDLQSLKTEIDKKTEITTKPEGEKLTATGDEKVTATEDQEIRPKKGKRISHKTLSMVLIALAAVGITVGGIYTVPPMIEKMTQGELIQPKTAAEFVERANKRLELGKTEQALADFEEALEIRPGMAEAWKGKGKALRLLGKPEEAFAAYKKAFEFKPNDPEIFIGVGGVLSDQGEYKDALAAFDKAVEIDPNNSDAWNERGLVLANLQQYKEALASYDKAIKIKPDHKFAWANRGDALFAVERYKEAINAYEQDTKIDPNNPYSWSRRGEVLAALERYKEAIASYNKALEINQNYSPAWIGKGLVLRALGRHEEG